MKENEVKKDNQERDVLATLKQRIVADVEAQQSQTEDEEGSIEDGLKVAMYEILKLERELSDEKMGGCYDDKN